MADTIIEFEGVYGGAQSRDMVLRILKEALALVENMEAGTELICSGFRIEQLETEGK
ncbi:MAG TPA: hypothetical protein VF707_17085 [Ardenticatenaceae bacterium]